MAQESPWLLVVLLVADVLAPGRTVPLVIDFEHCEVGHEAVGGGAMPVLLAWPKEHPVTGTNNLDWPATPLRKADTLSHVDRLAMGMGVPCRPGAGREVDAARAQTRACGGRRDWIDINRAREPLTRTSVGRERVLGKLHRRSPS